MDVDLSSFPTNENLFEGPYPRGPRIGCCSLRRMQSNRRSFDGAARFAHGFAQDDREPGAGTREQGPRDEGARGQRFEGDD
jgi:hypothetical protein